MPTTKGGRWSADDDCGLHGRPDRMVSAIGVLIVNSKVDRLTGRVGTLEKAVLAKL